MWRNQMHRWCQAPELQCLTQRFGVRVGRRTEYKPVERVMVDDSETVKNEISDQTGQYDARFVLWRTFCATNNVPVETLPGDLDDEKREKWETLKKEKLS
jgi:hypothetical protein